MRAYTNRRVSPVASLTVSLKRLAPIGNVEIDGSGIITWDEYTENEDFAGFEAVLYSANGRLISHTGTNNNRLDIFSFLSAKNLGAGDYYITIMAQGKFNSRTLHSKPVKFEFTK